MKNEAGRHILCTTSRINEEDFTLAKRNRNQDRKMTVEEAGRKGGEATSKSHDREFYEEIGKKGGETTAQNHDKEFYQDIGQKGGEARARQSEDNPQDKMTLEEAGRKGGEARKKEMNRNRK